MTTKPLSLSAIMPTVGPQELLRGLVPPKHFGEATFASYQPNADFPSQGAALERMKAVSTSLQAAPKRGLFGRSKAPAPTYLYLDGGFGVGKTHLLAALAREVGPQRAAFGTFVEYTALVGALGFAQTVAALGEFRLLCIDEFELDDPGDTLIMSRLIREMAEAGVSVVATSNTLPGALGEGRFAAQDFLREIQALAARFEVLRIDGPDYRHRDAGERPRFVSDDALPALASAPAADGSVTSDDYQELLSHLKLVHPSRYGALVSGISRVTLRDVSELSDQHAALRFVVLVDRLYDNEVPVVLSTADGAAVEIFAAELLGGGYRKKYFRALSRLTALSRM